MNNTPNQTDPLVPLVKIKGVGRTMSKTLSAKECETAITIFSENSSHLTTQATFLTALLMLPLNEDETNLLQTLKHQYWPSSLNWLLNVTPHPLNIIGRKLIARQDLNQEEIQHTYHAIIDPATPESTKAILLESLRLKSETFYENTAAYDTFWDITQRHLVTNHPIIDCCYPYDGFTRYLNLGPFLASLLASVGHPTILHGTPYQGPKYGISHATLLALASKAHIVSAERCISDLNDPSKGWAYIDLSQFNSTLVGLQGLRTRMVKRPVLATIEKHLQPIRSTHHHHVVAGYTHPPYKDKMVQILSHRERCDSILVLRGTEGSPQLQPDRRSPYVALTGNGQESGFLSPNDYGLMIDRIPPNPSITAEETLSCGIAGLKNEHPIATPTLLFSALGILKWRIKHTDRECLAMLKTALSSGKAYAHWEAGMTR